MSELSRYDPGYFTTPGSYSVATGDEMAASLAGLLPGAPIAAMGQISFRDKPAYDLFSPTARMMDERLTQQVGPGWAKRMLDVLKYSPREYSIGTGGRGGDIYVPGAQNLPVKITVDANPGILRTPSINLLGHELTHGFKNETGSFYSGDPGIQHNLRGLLSMLIGRYPRNEWASEVFPNFFSGESKIYDPRAFRDMLEATTQLYRR